eukprot:CAMPEP_0194046352 /NCGR_PEP_ID=MMETSP0009_2-20130614/20998_1 /TAXON_ID=210454 /ORGANISM="Grammatophora oceanica, Strain CCMP 410" /LENGTH=100 /DNA_ID=CAMNT_0038691607 /DNA_START=80 /DNA_END=382 /DNA_ORIENTATION=-
MKTTVVLAVVLSSAAAFMSPARPAFHATKLHGVTAGGKVNDTPAKSQEEDMKWTLQLIESWIKEDPDVDCYSEEQMEMGGAAASAPPPAPAPAPAPVAEE